MAGDWLEWCKGLVRKVEVLKIAARLNIRPTDAAGTLMVLMEWVDENVREFDEHGNAHVTLSALPSSALDVTAGTPGFISAMKEVGWIEEKDGELTFIHVGRHNGQTAKDRALTRRRVSKHRAKEGVKRIGNANGVTTSSLLLSDSEKGSLRGNRPSVEEWIEACLTKYPDWTDADAEAAWNHYEANGWRIGKNPVKRWKACIVTCHQFWLEKRQLNGTAPPAYQPHPFKPIPPEPPAWRETLRRHCPDAMVLQDSRPWDKLTSDQRDTVGKTLALLNLHRKPA
jgi:hypothetical protein